MCTKQEVYATAALCPHCKGPCNVKKESCSKCHKKIADSLKEKFNEVTDFTAQHLETMRSVACILLCQLEWHFFIIYLYFS